MSSESSYSMSAVPSEDFNSAEPSQRAKSPSRNKISKIPSSGVGPGNALPPPEKGTSKSKGKGKSKDGESIKQAVPARAVAKRLVLPTDKGKGKGKSKEGEPFIQARSSSPAWLEAPPSRAPAALPVMPATIRAGPAALPVALVPLSGQSPVSLPATPVPPPSGLMTAIARGAPPKSSAPVPQPRADSVDSPISAAQPTTPGSRLASPQPQDSAEGQALSSRTPVLPPAGLMTATAVASHSSHRSQSLAPVPQPRADSVDSPSSASQPTTPTSALASQRRQHAAFGQVDRPSSPASPTTPSAALASQRKSNAAILQIQASAATLRPQAQLVATPPRSVETAAKAPAPMASPPSSRREDKAAKAPEPMSSPPSARREDTTAKAPAPMASPPSARREDGFAGLWSKGTISNDCTKLSWKSGGEEPVKVVDGKLTFRRGGVTYSGTLHGDQILWSNGSVWQREDQASDMKAMTAKGKSSGKGKGSIFASVLDQARAQAAQASVPPPVAPQTEPLASPPRSSRPSSQRSEQPAPSSQRSERPPSSRHSAKDAGADALSAALGLFSFNKKGTDSENAVIIQKHWRASKARAQARDLRQHLRSNFLQGHVHEEGLYGSEVHAEEASAAEVSTILADERKTGVRHILTQKNGKIAPEPETAAETPGTDTFEFEVSPAAFEIELWVQLQNIPKEDRTIVQFSIAGHPDSHLPSIGFVGGSSRIYARMAYDPEKDYEDDDKKVTRNIGYFGKAEYDETMRESMEDKNKEGETQTTIYGPSILLRCWARVVFRVRDGKATLEVPGSAGVLDVLTHDIGTALPREKISVQIIIGGPVQGGPDGQIRDLVYVRNPHLKIERKKQRPLRIKFEFPPDEADFITDTQKEIINQHKWYKFDTVFGVFVVLNSVCIGLAMDHGEDPRNKTIFVVADHFFIWLFLAEFLLRAFLIGRQWYRSLITDSWFSFDLFCVISSLVTLFLQDERSSIFRMLKMLRLLKLAKMVRLFRMFKDLGLLLECLLSSFGILCYTVIFLFVGVYMTALAVVGVMNFSSSFGGGQQDDSLVWYSLGDTMWILARIATFDHWADEIREVWQQCEVGQGMLVSGIMAGYVVLAGLGVFNMLVGIFCQSALVLDAKLRRRRGCETLLKQKLGLDRFVKLLKQHGDLPMFKDERFVTIDELLQAVSQDPDCMKLLQDDLEIDQSMIVELSQIFSDKGKVDVEGLLEAIGMIELHRYDTMTKSENFDSKATRITCPMRAIDVMTFQQSTREMDSRVKNTCKSARGVCSQTYDTVRCMHEKAQEAQTLLQRSSPDAWWAPEETGIAVDWRVAHEDGVPVRKARDVNSLKLGFKKHKDQVRGILEGDWLKLLDEPGHILTYEHKSGEENGTHFMKRHQSTHDIIGIISLAKVAQEYDHAKAEARLFMVMDLLFGALITLNAMFVGMQMTGEPPAELSLVLSLLDGFFTFLFSIELVLRVFLHGNIMDIRLKRDGLDHENPRKKIVKLQQAIRFKLIPPVPKSWKNPPQNIGTSKLLLDRCLTSWYRRWPHCVQRRVPLNALLDMKMICSHSDVLFDVVVVTASLLDLLILMHIRAALGGGVSAGSFVKILRMFRLVKLARLLRLYQMFTELQDLLFALHRTWRTILWTQVLMFMVIYAFAIYSMVSIRFEPYFDTFAGALVTGFQLATFDQWGDIIRDVSARSPFNLVVIFALAMVLGIGIMKMSIGVMCESAMQLMVARASRKKQSQLIKFFEEMAELHEIAYNRLGTPCLPYQVLEAALGVKLQIKQADEFSPHSEGRYLLSPHMIADALKDQSFLQKVREKFHKAQLTPEMVKQVVERVDSRHLGHVSVDLIAKGAVILKEDLGKVQLFAITNVLRDFRRRVAETRQAFVECHGQMERLLLSMSALVRRKYLETRPVCRMLPLDDTTERALQYLDLKAQVALDELNKVHKGGMMSQSNNAHQTVFKGIGKIALKQMQDAGVEVLGHEPGHMFATQFRSQVKVGDILLINPDENKFKKDKPGKDKPGISVPQVKSVLVTCVLDDKRLKVKGDPVEQGDDEDGEAQELDYTTFLVSRRVESLDGASESSNTFGRNVFNDVSSEVSSELTLSGHIPTVKLDVAQGFHPRVVQRIVEWSFETHHRGTGHIYELREENAKLKEQWKALQKEIVYVYNRGTLREVWRAWRSYTHACKKQRKRARAEGALW